MKQVDDREIAALEAAYTAWEFERRPSGKIMCTLGGYHGIADDADGARRLIIARLRELSEPVPEPDTLADVMAAVADPGF